MRGFYNESLAGGAALARSLRMRPAFLIDIDSDIYTSAKEALRFALDAGVLVAGTHVYYDDISEYERWSYQQRQSKRLRAQRMNLSISESTNAPLSEELRAHLEISQEYGLSWQSLPPLGRYLGPVASLDWIVQKPAGEKGKPVAQFSYSPVLQLLECAKCSHSPLPTR